jgi:general secretion pathway protein D
MRYVLLFGLFLFATNAISADKVTPPKGARLSPEQLAEKSKSKFDLHGASVAQVISLVYMEAFKQSYVIDPSVLRDERLVSFRFDASNGDMRQFWIDFLDSLGFSIEQRKGVDFVFMKRIEEKLEKLEDTSNIFVYRPRCRSLSYLTNLLTPIFKTGNFSVNRVVHTPKPQSSTVSPAPSSNVTAPSVPFGSAAALIDTDSDVLIFEGSLKDIEKLKILLSQVDTAVGEVLVKAVVYEVSTGKSDETAFSLALNLLGGKLGINLGSSGVLTNSISLKTSNIDLAFSALSGDSRFKTVSTPSLRVKSGSQARLTVGQDVPTLGSLSFPQGGGQAVQSVVYQSSGVILSVTPVVHDESIDLAIDQQISDFVRTESGVNSSPTLTKRAFSTNVVISDHEIILLGGLTQDKDINVDSGLSFLPRFLHTKNRSDMRTEVLMMLEVTRIKR